MMLAKLIDATPSLPMSVIQLNELQRNPNRSIRDIANIVETDPILSAKILGLINAPLYGMRSEITSITMACAQLGETAIFSLSILIGLHNHFKFDLQAYGISEREFLFNTIMQMRLMNEWIALSNPEYANELRLAAFLSDIGKVLVCKLLKDADKEQLLREKLAQGVTEPNAELAVLGTTSLEVSAQMLAHWKVNERVVQILQHTRDNTGATYDIKVAVAMMESVHNLWHYWGKDAQSIKQAALMGFVLYDPADYPKFEQAVDRVLEHLRAVRAA